MTAERVLVLDPKHDATFCAWVSDKLPGCEFNPSECRTIGHVLLHEDRDPEIIGAVVLSRWTAHTCDASIASDGTKRWATRRFIFAVYDYAFRHADKSRINFIVRVDNADSIRLQERLGHTLDGRLADAFGEGQDALLFGLTRSAWLAGPWRSPSRPK